MPKQTDEQIAGQVKALLEERRAYELHGSKDQVDAVNAELKRLGHKGSAPSKRATTRKK